MDAGVSFEQAHSFTQIMQGNAYTDQISEFKEITGLASSNSTKDLSDVEAEKQTYSFRNMLIYIKAY